MSEKIAKLMNDSPLARWTVLVLVALMMFFAYMFVDVMSPLKSLVESDLGWNSSVFGKYAASEYILNVCGFLILAGVILDKLGVRFSGILSAGLMVAGAAIKFVGISDWFQTTGFAQWLGSWWVEMPASAKMASLGFMIFGCGCEMEGTNVSKILAKWFKGKEMALAMGLEMAIARLGVFAVMWIAPIISNAAGGSILAPLGFCGALLCIGLINFIIFGVMDRKFDSQLVAAGMATEEKSPEDEFHISDLGAIFKSKMFWIVALLSGGDLGSGRRHRRTPLQLLPHPGNVPHPAPGYLPRPCRQRRHHAHAGVDNHDSMPPELCFRTASLPAQMVCSAAHRSAWRELLAGSRCPLAQRSQNH